jgi:hypothetical protein
LTDLTDNWKNEELCATASCDAEDSCKEWGVAVSSRIKKINSIPNKNASDSGWNIREKMHRFLREILNKTGFEISSEIKRVDLVYSAMPNQ